MAFPTVRARTETALTTAGTTITINFGTNNAGDYCIAFIALNDTAQAITVTESFTNLTNASGTFHIIGKQLAGTEGTSTTVTVPSSTKAAVLAYTINTGTYLTTQVPQFSTVATGTSTAPNSGSLSPTGGAKDYLWISAFRQNGEEADDDTWVSSAPTTPGTFTNLIQKTSGTASTATTNGSLAAAEYTSYAASMDPGAFTVDQSLAWRAYTVAIHPLYNTFSNTFAADAVIKATITPTGPSPTVAFTCGAECATLSAHWAGAINGSRDTALKSTGAASIKITATGSYAYVQNLHTATSHLVTRFTLYLDALPVADSTLWGIQQPTSQNYCMAYDSATGKLCVAAQADWATRVLGPVIAAQTWVVIDIHIDWTTPTAVVLSWRVADVAQTNLTDTGSAPSGTTSLFYGQDSGIGITAYSTWTAHYDDIAISLTGTDYPIAPGIVVSGETWVPDSGIPVNAVLAESPVGEKTGHFHADALKKATQTGSFTASAVIAIPVTTYTFTDKKADAVLFKGMAGSFAANAVIKKAQAGTFTGNAVIKKTVTPTTTANAVIMRTQTGTFAANAVVKKSQAGSLPANAVILKSQTGSFAANAVKYMLPVSKTIDAVIGKSQAGALSADAIHKRTFYFGSGPDPR